MDQTDEALYESFITENDERSIRVLFDRYRDPLIYYIGKIVQNIDDAEEIMMDCFAVVVAGTARFRARGSSFKTWLYAIATKRAYMFLRKNHTSVNLDQSEDIAADELMLPESMILKEEKNRELYKAMNTLSSDQRTVLYLKFFEDMAPSEISRIMRKSVKQIYKLTDKGKNRLRELLAGSVPEGDKLWDI